MVKSIVREHHWPPDIISGLFFDAEDYQGLVYWYEDVREVDASLKEKKPKQTEQRGQ